MDGLSMGGVPPEYSTRGGIICGMRLSPGPEIVYIWGPVLEVPMGSLKVHEGGLVSFPRGEQLRGDQLYSLTNEMTSTDRGTDVR